MDFVSTTELSEILNMPRVTAYVYARKRVFPTTKIAGRYLVKVSDIPEIRSLLEIKEKFKGVSKK